MQCDYTRIPTVVLTRFTSILSTAKPKAMGKACTMQVLSMTFLAIFLALSPKIAWSQCATAPLSGPVDITINLSPGGTAILDEGAVVGVINPADGPMCVACILWFENPASPGVWATSLNMSCDGSTPNGEGAYNVVASVGDPSVDPTCPSTPVVLNVTLNDNNGPTIDDTDGATPDCGVTVNLTTANDYSYGADAPVVGAAATGDCATAFTWTHPTITDNCSFGPASTVVISYSAGMVAPDALPTDVTISGAAAIDAAFNPAVSTSATFYGSSTGCGAETIVTYTATDESGNTSTCTFLVVVSDNENPVWDAASTATALSVLLSGDELDVSTVADPFDPGSYLITVTLDCNSTNFGADSVAAINYFPQADDNCDASVTVAAFDSSSTAVACSGSMWGPIYASSYKDYSAEDNCMNVLDGTMGSDARFRIQVDVVDNTSPEFTVVPEPIHTVSGPSNAQVFEGDTLTLFVSDYNPAVCEIDLTGNPLLAVTATDCQPVTYSWTITSSVDPFGVPTGLAGTSSGPNDNNADINYPVGVHEITYFADDACMLQSTYIFYLEIVDDVPPVITDCPADITANNVTDLCEYTVVWPLPGVTDNCGATVARTDQAFDPNGLPVTVVVFTPDSAFAIFPVGVNQVLHIFTDTLGNIDTCTFTVTVYDAQPPVITCGGDLTLFSICGTAPLPNYMGNIATIDENCPGYTLAQYPAPGTLLNVIKSPNPVDGDTIHVSLILTDVGGNMDTCTFVVTLVDNDAPIPTVDPLPAINPMTTLGTTCGSYMLCAPTATDCNMGTTIYATTSIAGATFDPNGCGPGVPGYLIHNPGNYSIAWTYTAGNGKTAVQQQQVDIEADVTDPTLNCPADITVSTDPGVCTTTGIIGIGMTEIFPTIAPYLDPADQPADGQMIDNCGITQFGWTTTSGYAANTPDPNAYDAGTATFNEGVNTVTYTAADAAGNIGTCQFTVTVEDNEPPTFSCPGLAGFGNAAIRLTGSAGDAIPGDCAYTLDVMDTSLDPTMLADNCGATVLSYSITLFGGAASFTPGPNPSSLAGSTFAAISLFGDASFRVTWTLTDGSGNTTTCVRWIRVIDGESPVITCPSSPQVRTTSQDGNPGDCLYTASGGEFNPTGTSDNCQVWFYNNDYDLTPSLNGSSFPSGTTLVTWTAWDLHLNSGSCQIEIIVQDDEPPVNIYCPNDIVLPNIMGDCNNFASWVRPSQNSWVDNCNPSSILSVTEVISDPGVQAAINLNFPYDETGANNLIPITIFAVGTTTITYTASDTSGNTDVCSFTVTIEDIEAPTISCPPDQILGTICLNGVVPDYRGLATGIFDNCPSSLIITQDPAPGTLLGNVPGLIPADGATFIVELKVADGFPLGLADSCTFVVTLMETNLPQPDILVLPSLLDSCSVIDVQAPTANDCGNVIYGVPNVGVLIQFNPPVYRFTTGLYNVIWTYIGASGNTIQGQAIEVQDDVTPPVTLCKSLAVVLSSSNPGGVTLAAFDFDDGSTDHCGIVAWDYSVNGGPFASIHSFGCDEVGVHTIVLRTTDDAGNQSTCQTSLTIDDVTNPTILGGCPANVSVTTVNNGGYDCEGLATVAIPNVTDNCDIVIYELHLVLPDLTPVVYDVLGQPVWAASLPKGVTSATLYVEDEHGNSASCGFTITVTDNEDPFVNCPVDQVRSNDPGLCSYTAVGGEFDPTSFGDNCPGAFIFNSYNGLASLDGEVFPVGSHLVFWTVIDAVGRFATCSFTIVIEDNESPQVLWCQPDITQVATAGTCNALVSWSPTYGIVGDVDDNCGIFNITESISDPSVIPVYPYLPFGPFPPFLLNQALFPVGTTTITYTVEDIHGNTAECIFHVDIIDDQPPSIACPPNQILSTICASGSVPDYTGLISNLTDNCVANLIITQDPVAGTPLSGVPGLTPADGESFTVTLTATDGHPLHLSADCQFLVTLDDVNLPIPDQAMLPNLFSDCESIIVSPPTANDCGNVLLGIPDKGNQISFNPPMYQFDIGLYTVIWTYVGVNGSTQQVQQIQVGPDNIPPTATCVNATVILDANGNGSLSAASVTGSVNDNCGIDNVSVSPNTFTCAHVGANIVTLTVTDIFGNTGTCTASVLVQDLTPPAFNLSGSTTTANCNAIPGIPNVFATDACGLASSTFNETSTKSVNANNCGFYNYTITRTWTATDVNGNVATMQRIINVQDISAPGWTQSMPDTVFATTNAFNCTGGITLIVGPTQVVDNCAAFANLSISFSGSNGFSGTTNASGQYPLGTTTLVFTATDPCGNSAIKVVRVIVTDATPPTPVCINSITLPLNLQGELVIPPQVVDNGSYDNCLTPFSMSDIFLDVFPDTFDCDDAGKTLTVTLTVTDLAGNTATCPAQVTIIDNTVPTLISCAPDVTISCTADTGYLSLGVPQIDDACGTSFTYTDNIVQVGGAICYRIDRTWLLLDGSGNNITCLQRISVFDNVPPVFTSALPQDITLECGLPIPAAAQVTASDNCSTASVNLAISTTKTNTLNCSDYAYVLTRTWTATDACGNVAVHVQEITINDTTPPVIAFLPDTMILYTNNFNADSCTVPVVLNADIADCQPDSVIDVTNNGPFGPGNTSASGSYPAGVYNIVFTAEDRCGNVSQEVVHLQVIDNSTPVAVCFSNINVSLNSQGFAILTPAQVDDNSHDNCTPHGNLLLELSQDSFDCTQLGQQIVTLTVTDAAGNTNACTSIVTVNAGPGNEINHTAGVTFETFPNSADGAISVTASGGSGNFTYLWSPGGQTTPSISGLTSGTYTLVITDVVTGCKKTIMIFVGVLGVPDIKISGRILTTTGVGIGRVHVNMTGSQSGSYYTANDGYYEFTVPAGSTVTITPFKDTLPANGVTSLDFAIIQQHILAPPGLKPLTTPYQLIAADQNGNDMINGIDIAQFQNTILNNFPNFPDVTSWVFVDADFVFPSPLAPWSTGWDASVTFTNIGVNAPNTDFIGVKMGDVTNDADPTKFTGQPEVETRNDGDIRLSLTDQVLEAGTIIRVPVRAAFFEQFRAYQFGWAFHPDVLAFKGIQPGVLAGVNAGQFGTGQLKQGLIPHLWYAGAPVTLAPEDVIYTLEFEVLQSGQTLQEVLGLTGGHLGRIAYAEGASVHSIHLNWEDQPVETPDEHGFALLGNRPNPFSHLTQVEYVLPEPLPVVLTVTDLAGRAVARFQADGAEGRNTLVIHQDQLPGPGIYLYVLQAGEHRALGKMHAQD